ncbi:MAG: exodeoxyribonuclease III [Oligoflexales bacterium]
MLVAAWNVNSVRTRLQRLIHFLERHQPDVLCLSELKCEDHQFPYEAIDELGYHYEVYGEKRYNGVAILSRFPIRKVTRGFDDGQSRYISGEIRGVRVCSIYVPNGREVGCEHYDYKLKWFEALAQTLKSFSLPYLVCGDFNVAPQDKDVYEPEQWSEKILCSTPEREALQKLLDQGCEDTFIKLNPRAKNAFSWWDYRSQGFEKNHGLRIDFILAEKSLAAGCKEAWIDIDERSGEQPSDHAPVLARFSSKWQK